MAAPALAAPNAASAISLAVTGKCGDMLGVWIAPVTAQVMMTLRGMKNSLDKNGQIRKVLVAELQTKLAGLSDGV
jgi:hypothetical protein